MRYAVSDIHGEYDMFLKLLESINFSDEDEMFVCGDIIDKGKQSVRLLKFIAARPNIHCIMGNHEYEFLKYYKSLLENSPEDFDYVLEKIREYFPYDGALLDWDTVDWIEELPYYIETDDFICVHAGIPIKSDGALAELSSVNPEALLYDRRFKNSDSVHKSKKCVFFGHTQTDCVCGEPRVLAYLRSNRTAPYTLADFYKLHLDTGSWSNGTLGCFCLDECKAYYVRRHRSK